MTNSIENSKAESILNEVFGLLNESHIQQTIDAPIKLAAAEFVTTEYMEPTFDSFMYIIGAFVKQVYQLSIFCNQQLTDIQARSEAVAILDTYYRNVKDNGLMAAYLNTRNSELDGLEFIIEQLTAILIQIAREKHVRWIFSHKIYPLEWSLKCDIVETILEQNYDYLPEDIRNCPPGILTAQISDLIQAVASSEQTAKNFLTNQLYTFDDQQSIKIETSNHILLLSLLKSFIE